MLGTVLAAVYRAHLPVSATPGWRALRRPSRPAGLPFELQPAAAIG